jgi:hypothetical protein
LVIDRVPAFLNNPGHGTRGMMFRWQEGLGRPEIRDLKEEKRRMKE